MLKVSTRVRARIQAETDAEAIRKLAFNEDMMSLRVGAAYQVIAGLTTVDEVLKVVPPSAD